MQGNYLIAHPMLTDGYFKRAVLYLTEHSEEGSLGFVLNFRTDLLLRDVFPHVKNGNFPIFEGGPVSKNQLYFLHTLKDLSESIQVKDNLYWGGNFFELAHLIDHGKVKQTDIRFFVGYSGWSPKQLDEELIQKAWFKTEANTSEILLRDPKTLWGEELEKVKETYKVFADIGFDPNLN